MTAQQRLATLSVTTRDQLQCHTGDFVITDNFLEPTNVIGQTEPMRAARGAAGQTMIHLAVGYRLVPVGCQGAVA